MKAAPFKTDEANLKWILNRVHKLQDSHSRRNRTEKLGVLTSDLAYLQQCADLVIAISALVPSANDPKPQTAERPSESPSEAGRHLRARKSSAK